MTLERKIAIKTCSDLYVSGMSFGKIADKLGVPVDIVADLIQEGVQEHRAKTRGQPRSQEEQSVLEERGTGVRYGSTSGYLK